MDTVEDSIPGHNNEAVEGKCPKAPMDKKGNLLDEGAHHWERAHDRTLVYTCNYCRAKCKRDSAGNTVAFTPGN